MSGPLQSSQWMYATGAAETGQSLRFEDGDSAYLSWTPASAGDRKTWTWSGWVKRGNLGSYQSLFGAGTTSPAYAQARFSNTDTIQYFVGGAATYIVETNAKYRDVGAWYHIVVTQDTTQATAADRIKIYVNGEQATFSSATYPTQNSDWEMNYTYPHALGSRAVNGTFDLPLDGYLANVCFIDGTALDPTSFGEYQTGTTLWKPKSDTDITSNLTFGQNGFYLPFKQTTSAEGFSAVTYTGTGVAGNNVTGIGFEPDLLWVKNRTAAYNHLIVDSVRGAGATSYKELGTNTTASESEYSNITALNSSGFTIGSTLAIVNTSGSNYIAWAWDAGSGSAVSNTDGSITSSVKANTAKGFSIVTWTGNDTAGATIGHGLDSTPEITIIKKRSATLDWQINLDSSITGTAGYLNFNTAALYTGFPNYYTSANSTVLSTNGTTTTERQYNNQSADYVAYCWHSVSGYSKIGSYSGTGSSGNAVTGLGFKPAFLMIKRTDVAADWIIWDTTRDVDGKADSFLYPNLSNAEAYGTNVCTFDSDGFTLNDGTANRNASGGTYIYMAFADTRDATFFGDTSGNGNNWTPNYLNNTDVVLDGPYNGGNFATNMSTDTNAMTYSEGNLKLYYTSTTTWQTTRATMGVSSGKWYWEALAGGTTYNMIGIVADTFIPLNGSNNYAGSTTDSYGYLSSTGALYNNGTSVAYGASYTSGDIIGVALDLDAGTLTFYKNGVSQGTAATGLTGTWIPAHGTRNSLYLTMNYGQDSSFAGRATPQGNTDDNGLGDFAYPVPSGHLSLNTANMSEPNVLLPEDYFKPLLYTGTGATQSITGLGWQPDFVWIKNRTEAYNHRLYDSIRGATYWLSSSGTNAETLDATELTSFDSDGFSVGSGFRTNKSGNAFVAWNWLLDNTTGSSNTDGSITTTVSANPTSGVSAIAYTGTGAVATIGHGLTQAPEAFFIKNRSSGTTSWGAWHTAIGATHYMTLQTTNAASAYSGFLNNTAPTSSVITLGNWGDTNGSGSNHICYAFHSVVGFSAIGSYTGNGSADGPMVFTNGIRPAFVMVKNTNASSQWIMFDAERDTYNVADARLRANSSLQEATQTFADFLSNGFKIRGTGTDLNNSGQIYIYLAFAESPLKYANAR